jgi:hypothetical protein
MVVTAYLMVKNLAADLYKDAGQCLMELIKNSLVASMPDPERWEPKLARIEINLVPNHPLTGGPALVILDHGCGMTDVALERYFNWLGTPVSKLREHASGSHKGASQKGIGRFAALALNESCLDDDPLVAMKHGYYMFSRTSPSGDIRFVQVIPEMMETEGGLETNRFISPAATEAKFLNNVKGSFTAIVIPTPVFKTAGKIESAIEYLLPRERDKMFDLSLNGRAVELPSLANDLNIVSGNGLYRARLGVGDITGDGCWLCDADTGFRVASCQALGQLLPDPLSFPDLIGDIFAPNLLRHQNTARSTLAKEFTRKSNPEWAMLSMFLVGQVAPAAKEIIERDVIAGRAVEVLDDIVSMFHDKYGVPVEPNDGPHETRDPVPRLPPAPGPRKPGGPKDGESHRRCVSIKIHEKAYRLYRGQPLDPFVFAQPHLSDSRMILVNVRGYKALPKNRIAMREHCLMQVLAAIGRIEHKDSPLQAVRFANEVRAEFS